MPPNVKTVVSDAKRFGCLSISASTDAEGLPAAARDAVVADHPIWTVKSEEYRLTLDPGHWFTFINFGFMVTDVNTNVSFVFLVSLAYCVRAEFYRVGADVSDEQFTTSDCL